MNLPVWCARLAADFWARAGGELPFPRRIEDVAAGAVPLTVTPLRPVSVSAVVGWFARRGLSVPLDEPDRPLRACLVARHGDGFAFLDAADPPDEQNFSLAHELGHFLRDYLNPRERAAAKLGPAALGVLDGHRPPTTDERVSAVLRGVPLGAFAHLLRRDEAGRPLTAAERESEDAADRLAFELLAPASALGEPADRATLVERLVNAFGLPPGPAARYAELLLPTPAPLGGLFRRLRSH